MAGILPVKFLIGGLDMLHISNTLRIASGLTKPEAVALVTEWDQLDPSLHHSAFPSKDGRGWVALESSEPPPSYRRDSGNEVAIDA